MEKIALQIKILIKKALEATNFHKDINKVINDMLKCTFLDRKNRSPTKSNNIYLTRNCVGLESYTFLMLESGLLMKKPMHFLDISSI